MQSNYSKYSSIVFVFLLFFLNSNIYCQPKSNFDVITSLIDQSVDRILNQHPISDKLVLEFNASSDYSVLKNSLILSLQNHNKTVELSDQENLDKLDFSIIDVKITYDDVFKDGFFGNYLVNRTVSLKTNYLLVKNSLVSFGDKIDLIKKDTVNYDDIKKLENSAYPFTEGKIPSIPFFSTILEPIIALGTVAITVFLFFTVRSN